MADGYVDGSNLVCGVHQWDYRLDSGVSEYDNTEALHQFRTWISPDTDAVLVDEDEVENWAGKNPQPFERQEYLGLYQDPHGGPEEPHNAYIQGLARDGLDGVGHHGQVSARALGADAVAIANSALQAIGCLGMRACHTDNCPVGIATQKKGLRSRLVVQESARRLGNYLNATTELMKVLARACGHRHLSDFSPNDLSTWDREIAALSGVRFAGP